MDIGKKSHRDRLFKAVEHSFQRLGQCRRTRAKLIDEYAGDLYPGRAHYRANTTQYVNFMLQASRAYAVGLAYNDPRFRVSSSIKQLKPFARRGQTGLNGLAQMIHLSETVQEVVDDAFFLMGISKTYLADMAQVGAEVDPFMDPGIPFVGRVSFDNWVHDIYGNRWRECGFMGDRYFMRLDDARNSDRFDEKVRKKLQAVSASASYEGGTASNLTGDKERNQHEIDPMVELIDLYLPRERQIVTVACNSGFYIPEQEPLAVYDWDGAETGPYNFLEFCRVPDNLMPVSIAGNIRPLFALTNNLLLKLSRRARNQKDLMIYEPGSDDDAGLIKAAEDQEAVAVKDAAAVKQFSLGGVDQSLTIFATSMMELGKQNGVGNIDLLTGAGPVAPTASQEASIAQQAARQEAVARRETDKFVSKLGLGLMDLMYDDPYLVVPGERAIDGADYMVDCSWLPPDALPRECRPSELDILCEPYSMEFKHPTERLGNIRQLLMDVMPFQQQMEGEGIKLNFKKLLEMQGELANEPDYIDLFDFSAAPPQTPYVGSQKSSAANGGPHEYIRHNVSSGPTGNARQQMLMQSLAQAGQAAGSDQMQTAQ